MNYALQETIKGILAMNSDIKQLLIEGLNQAAEGCLNENIVYSHLLLSRRKNDTVFMYCDKEDREVDAVIINRETKTLRLIEVKSKTRIDTGRSASKDIRHLMDVGILKNIGIDDSFAITRIVVYRGKNQSAISRNSVLLLINIEELLVHYADLGHYLDQMATQAEEIRSEKYPKPLIDKIREKSNKQKQDYVPPVKSKNKDDQNIGD
jgi:hypothetical protein